MIENKKTIIENEKTNRSMLNTVVGLKLQWEANKNITVKEYLTNLDNTLNLIVIPIQRNDKVDYHKINIIENSNYVRVDKSGRSGDNLYLFREKNDENFIALLKILKKYTDTSDPQANKTKEVVNSYYMGEIYSDYFPKIYDIGIKDDDLYINMELVNGEEFTKICKKINIKGMKEILFAILHALVKIKDDKIFFKHYDIHPDNILVQKVDPYQIKFNNKTYVLNYKIKFIDLGRSFVFTNVEKDMSKVSERVIEMFGIQQRDVPLASYQCSETSKIEANVKTGLSFIFSTFQSTKKYDDIDLYFIKELFEYIYKVICKQSSCDNLKITMDDFKKCNSLDECTMHNFFDDIVETKGGDDPYYRKYLKYKKKYTLLKNRRAVL